MQAVFKSELDNTEIENIRKFCNSVEYFAIEQSIGWSRMFYNSNVRYFYLTDDSEIKCFCQIDEKFKFAQIHLGPVCCDKEIMIESLNEIISYYKKRRFLYLGVQMYYKSGYDTDYIEYTLNKKYDVKYYFNDKNTKSSLEIDLDNDLEEIFSRIKKGHKANIKKAVVMGMTVEVVKDKTELTSFMDIHTKMCQTRNIDPGGLTRKAMDEVYDYLTIFNKGQVFIVRDNSGNVVGGAIMIYQGISVRYFIGASDPDRRDLPITHLIIYEAIKKAKNDKFKYFDFWGYSHFVNENDQVFYINQFKKLFGGYYIFLAKKMNINIFPYGYNIYNTLLFIRKIVRKMLFRK